MSAKYCQFYLLVFILNAFSCSERTTTVTEEAQFAKHVRTTEARTPAEEKAGFQLPPGFEIQLFASEPDIGKPLNMTFDTKGRMWLTQSFEYPFADTTGQGKDRISILEDTSGDGQADQFTTFADGLNIPIGIETVPNGAIAYSIPDISHFTDTDGDGQADERRVLYSGFQYKDTHGMINNLVRLWDGWVHADHGFANTSTVAGTDGDTIVMFSGNTFRFRADGSRIEFTTTGRVNPYGYAYDELGYTYSSDCHTSPIYQLVRGADYPHFGKKPTGIGFGPALMSHNYGSTALAGLEYYLGDAYPAAYQNSFYIGDVVKSRVYRSTMEMNGTTPAITWEDDFVVSDDPWFRPVDVKLGPDGALYIADFYNSIIGHYEVPLDHPGRDRHRGRIWRITYKGQSHNVVDWSAAALSELLQGLTEGNLPLRMKIANEIADRFGAEAVGPIRQMIVDDSCTPTQHIQGLWLLYRLNDLRDGELSQAIQSRVLTIRVHALRILFEKESLNQQLLQLAEQALHDEHPHVQRQAVMVLARHPDNAYVRKLLALKDRVLADDSHFAYVIRQALRDQLRDPAVLDWVSTQQWPEQDARFLAEVMVGVNTGPAGRFLLHHLERYTVPPPTTERSAVHIARHSAADDLDRLVGVLQQAANSNPQVEHTYYRKFQEGLDQEGKTMPAKGATWGIQMASTFLQDASTAGGQWRVLPNPKTPYFSNPWRLEAGTILASEPSSGGGRAISTIYSPVFTMPPMLTFRVAGRKNKPGANANASPPSNSIELRLAHNDSTIAAILITEGFTDQQVQWQGDIHEGKTTYLAVIDGSRAAGEFIAVSAMPPTLPLPEQSPDQLAEQQVFAAKIAKDHKVLALQPELNRLVQNEYADIYARAAAADALLHMDAGQGLSIIATLLENAREPLLLKEQLALLISPLPEVKALELLGANLGDYAYDRQKEIALVMAGTAIGIDALLEAGEASLLSPRLLLERQVQERFAIRMSGQQRSRLAAITADTKPPGEAIQALIDKRLFAFRAAPHSIEKGREAHTLYCAPCHQIKETGGNIGPQLDGIGNWGPQALTEKILDPNRNVSKAFMNYTIQLNNGQVRSGLFRRKDGELLVFADVAGQEFSIDKDEVKEQKLSPYTLMPDHFGEVIPEADFHALLAFLLNEK